jgi:riboflavin kinase/FMN adenylyltransferase
VIAGADTVVTFSPHPRAVVGEAPPLLHDLDSKIELLGDLGVSEVVLLPFDRELAAMRPEDFVDRVLVDALSATHVAVGANFHFGRRGAGCVADLDADPRFQTLVERLLEREGAVVSSTRIRALVEVGRIEAATRLLGAPFTTRCSLEHDVDSAQLSWPSGIIRPGPGTYAATVRGPSDCAADAIAAEVVVGGGTARLIPSSPMEAQGSAVVAMHERVWAPSGQGALVLK